MGRRRVDGVEQSAEVRDVFGHRMVGTLPDRLVRPVTPSTEGDDAEPSRERVPLAVPRPVVAGRSVDEYQRLAIPLLDVFECGTVDTDLWRGTVSMTWG